MNKKIISYAMSNDKFYSLLVAKYEQGVSSFENMNIDESIKEIIDYAYNVLIEFYDYDDVTIENISILINEMLKNIDEDY